MPTPLDKWRSKYYRAKEAWSALGGQECPALRELDHRAYAPVLEWYSSLPREEKGHQLARLSDPQEHVRYSFTEEIPQYQVDVEWLAARNLATKQLHDASALLSGRFQRTTRALQEVLYRAEKLEQTILRHSDTILTWHYYRALRNASAIT